MSTSSSMASPAQSASQVPTGTNQSDLFPLDFLSFSNFDPTSPQGQGQGSGQPKADRDQQSTTGETGMGIGIGMGMDFDFSQFQSQDPEPAAPAPASAKTASTHSRRGSFAGGGRKRGSVSSIGTGTGGGTRPTTAGGMDVDTQQASTRPEAGVSANDFQMMLDAATAAAAASAASANGNGHGNNGESFDQAGLLQQQLEHIHMQSPLVFGQFNGSHPAFQQSLPPTQSNSQGQSPYNALAQYLASPLAQTQTIGESQGAAGYSHSNNSSSSQDGGGDAEKKKWMLATGLGGLFTPGPSGEMIPQVRPEHMSPMQLEMLAREGIDGDFSSAVQLLSPALSQQQANSAYASPMTSATYPSVAPQQQAYNPQHLPPSPLEALQIQQRHFQEQLALLQHQQRQLQATAEAVAAASNSPYITAGSSSSAGASASASRPATTPGVGGGPQSTNASPSYFSPLTSPALEASHHRNFARHQQQQQFSPGFDPRGNRRTPHPLSALSSPALNPVGSSGGAQQTLSPALGPQTNADMADPEYIRALVGTFDGNGQPMRSQQQQQSLRQDGGSSAYASPIPLQSIDTAALSSPLVGPNSASSSSGPGPNRHSLPVRTRPSPMIKPTPAHRSQHSRNGSTHHSPIVATSHQHQQRYTGASVPHPNYLPPAAIDQRGVQAHHQQMALSTTSETPSPVDLSTIMPPPPVPGANGGKAVTPMTPAALMNLGAGRTPNATANDATPASSDATTTGQQQQSQVKRQNSGARASQTTRPVRKASVNNSASASATTPTMSASTPGSSSSAAGAGRPGNNAGKKVKIAPAGKRALAARPPGVGVRAATKGAAAAAALALPEGETRKTSHKAAEQKRRDSLKAGFDELRLLLPPINTEALDPESGEPIPGSSAPRLLPKSSLVPDDNPNRGVSKVALLKFSNEYIARLHEKVDKRDDYIERLRSEIERLRTGDADDGGAAEEVRGPDGEDLLEMNMLDGEEEYEGSEEGDEELVDADDAGGLLDDDELDLDGDDVEAGMELDEDESYGETTVKDRRRSKGTAAATSIAPPLKSPALNSSKRPLISRGLSNGGGRGRKVEA